MWVDVFPGFNSVSDKRMVPDSLSIFDRSEFRPGHAPMIQISEACSFVAALGVIANAQQIQLPTTSLPRLPPRLLPMERTSSRAGVAPTKAERLFTAHFFANKRQFAWFSRVGTERQNIRQSDFQDCVSLLPFTVSCGATSAFLRRPLILLSSQKIKIRTIAITNSKNGTYMSLAPRNGNSTEVSWLLTKMRCSHCFRLGGSCRPPILE